MNFFLFYRCLFFLQIQRGKYWEKKNKVKNNFDRKSRNVSFFWLNIWSFKCSNQSEDWNLHKNTQQYSYHSVIIIEDFSIHPRTSNTDFTNYYHYPRECESIWTFSEKNTRKKKNLYTARVLREEKECDEKWKL